MNLVARLLGYKQYEAFIDECDDSMTGNLVLRITLKDRIDGKEYTDVPSIANKLNMNYEAVNDTFKKGIHGAYYSYANILYRTQFDANKALERLKLYIYYKMIGGRRKWSREKVLK